MEDKMAQAAKTTKGEALIIVESPAKAGTLRKFLGAGYRVEASVGHIRDLCERKSDLPERDPRRDKAWVKYGVNIDNHFEPLEEVYLVSPDRRRQIDALQAAAKGVDRVLLATDDDREGEAIAWHLAEVLQPKVPMQRMVFHEITREAVQAALQQPRQLDDHLVEAQRARRIVDRLYGWDVSELLWRKIKPRLSAGRVQSVALRLLVQRERERLAFVVSGYASVGARFVQAGEGFDATLLRVGRQRVATGRDFDDTTGLLRDAHLLRLDLAAAEALCGRLRGQPAQVVELEVKPLTQRPSPPFTTSTLQQEANRKLRFSAKNTMSVAQRLYENGFITYMRTDSVTLSEQAETAARALIRDQYGADYLPRAPRRYQTKTANAQEAHEAIRPAGTQFPAVATVEATLGRDAARLYDLIWKRTVASQMPDAQLEQTTVDLQVADAVFRATGRVTRFAGYLKAYVEGSDDPEAALAERDHSLPVLDKGTRPGWGEPPLVARGHETRPPARHTDASLVKALEELGIGRPSTYAAILQNLLDKQYAFSRGSALVPSFMGMVVTQLLERHMPHLVDYHFTAEMESRLDAIARGEAHAGAYLRHFYEDGFAGVSGRERVPGLTALLREVRDQIDPQTASAWSVALPAGGEPTEVRIGRFGTFLKQGDRRATLPDDLAPDELSPAKVEELLSQRAKADAPLGHASDGQPVYLRNSRFGWYVQHGQASDGVKPKMVDIGRNVPPDAVTLEFALARLSLPRDLGRSPANGQPIEACSGRFGDYVRCGEETRNLPAGVDAALVSREEALALLERPRSRAGREHLRDLGVRASDGKTLALWRGRFGLYVSDGTQNCTLKGNADAEKLTLAEAEVLLAAAATERHGAVLGVDPQSGAEVRLLDGRFGPYLTDGSRNASLDKGMRKEDVTLDVALSRLQDYGKPVRTASRAGGKLGKGSAVRKKPSAATTTAGGKRSSVSRATSGSAAKSSGKRSTPDPMTSRTIGKGQSVRAKAGQAKARQTKESQSKESQSQASKVPAGTTAGKSGVVRRSPRGERSTPAR
jgi:DNA topoisomerase-1